MQLPAVQDEIFHHPFSHGLKRINQKIYPEVPTFFFLSFNFFPIETGCFFSLFEPLK